MKKRIKCLPFLIQLFFLLQFFVVQGQEKDTFDLGNEFIPAGYMGCVNNIKIEPSHKILPKSDPLCFKVSFSGSCPNRWAGCYWTNTTFQGQANWGQLPGSDLSGKKYAKLTFWAKGDQGGEVVEFGMFGINQLQYKDSCQKTTIKGRVAVLTKEWRLYEVRIHCESLKSVIGGFYWSASLDSNPQGVTFYLDDIFLIEQ